MTRLSFLIRREWLSLIFAAVLILLGLNAVLGPQGPRDLVALRSHREALETERARLVTDNAALGTSVQRLRSDRRYIEREIRLELGYARPDELIYKFTDEPATAAPR